MKRNGKKMKTEKMKGMVLRSVILITMAAGLSLAEAAAAKKPNIVILLADEHPPYPLLA
jgi:hypothetical protein